MKKENLLIICYDIKDFSTIENINITKYKTITVASDDYRIHEKCLKLAFIDSVTFLQKPLPYTVVAQDVISIVDTVNRYYNHVAKEMDIFKTEHMVWPYHIEGGNNTQKIQDTLLYIQNIKIIIDQYKIDNIITFSNSNYSNIEQVVYQVCLAKDISYNHIKKFKINVSKKRFKNFIRPFYYLYKTVKIKLENSFSSLKSEKNVALFWLFNSVQKHLNNAIFIDTVLKKSGMNPVLFSWRTSAIKNKPSLNIQPIEKYLDWGDIFISLWKNSQTLIYRSKLCKLYGDYKLHYLDVDITNIVKSIVLYHIFVEAPDSYRFSKGFDNFKKYIDVKMMSGDLGRQKIGLLTERTFPDHIPKFTFTTFLTGKNIYVTYMRQQYSESYWKHFKYFVQNEIEKRNLLEQINIDPENVIIYGTLRGNYNYINTMSKDEALKELEIDKNYDYYIMFDYPNQLNGYQSMEETVSSLITVLEVIKEREDIALLIKPHPSADTAFLEIIKNKYLYENIYYMKKVENPIPGLIVADVLITKYSTLGIESMGLNTIVLSLQLDASDVFRLYGEDGIYLDSIFDLKKKIGILTENKDTLLEIKENENKKNLKYLNDIYTTTNEITIIENIKQLIKGKST